MKKVLLVTGVAFLALASVSSAAFSTNLTVGSTGSDVSALQTWLISKGFDIPAISSGAANKGYFGSQTKTAVAAYQKSVGLPDYGFFGPLTQAKVNGDATVGTAPVSTACPAGYTCTVTPVTTPVVCPAGVTCTPNTGTTGTVVGGATGITTPGVAGTLATSLWTTPSGVTAYKGQSYDLAGYKLQASASDMAVSSISFDFNTRFWLYASAITIKDETGAVVGSVNNLNASNFSELTVGSDYRITIPVNLIVKATQSKYLTLNASFLGFTDRSSGDISITSAQIRAVDGTGVTDTETVLTPRSFSYQGTNVGQLVFTTDPSAPMTGTVQVSTAAQTQNVPLAIYDIKSQNQPSTLQSLTIGLNISSTTLPVGNLFANVQLKVGGLTYSASSLSSTSASFTNLQIPLAADVYVPMTISATLAQDTNNIYDNVYVTTTLNTGNTANFSVIDPTYNTLTANAVTLTSNAQSFTASGVTPSGLATSLSNVVSNAQSGASSTQTFTMSYSLTAGNNPIYVSKTYGTAITATTTGGIASKVTNISFRDNDSTNDGSTYFYIAPGQTKTFTVTNSAAGLPGTVSGTYSITHLIYGTDTSGVGGDLSASTIGNTLFATLSF